MYLQIFENFFRTIFENKIPKVYIISYGRKSFFKFLSYCTKEINEKFLHCHKVCCSVKRFFEHEFLPYHFRTKK